MDCILFQSSVKLSIFASLSNLTSFVFAIPILNIVSYLYVSCSGSITSVGEERANLSAIVYL